jgi:hypothetical protein
MYREPHDVEGRHERGQVTMLLLSNGTVALEAVQTTNRVSEDDVRALRDVGASVVAVGVNSSDEALVCVQRLIVFFS